MSGPLINQRIEVLQGIDFRETFLFFSPPADGSTDPVDLVPVDFTGADARMMVKPSAESAASAIFSLTIGGGLEWVADTIVPGPETPAYNNGIEITILSADSLLANSGVPIAAYYDLMVDWPNGEVSLLARGTFTLAATATR